MAKFCGKCGAKLDEATGLCPKCDVEKLAKLSSESLKEKEKQEVSAESEKPLSKKDIRRKKKAEKKASRKARKKEQRSGWSTGKKVRRFLLKFILVVLLLALIAGGVTGVLAYFGFFDIPVISEAIDDLVANSYSPDVEKNIPATDTRDFTFYQSSEENIARDADTGITFVNNEILVTLISESYKNQLEEYLQSIGGRIVGEIAELAEYQILLSDNHSYSDIKELVDAIESLDWVSSASPNYTMKMDVSYTPNDSKWKNKWEDIPDGDNWGMEAIDAPDAWEYRDQLQPVNIGILDDMFDTKHQDLTFAESPLGSALTSSAIADGKIEWSSHGTHTSGTIAAIFDNSKGVTGVSVRTNLYGVSERGLSTAGYYSSQAWNIALYYLIAEKKCSVVNISMAFDQVTFEASREETVATEVLNLMSQEIEKCLKMLIERDYQFVICKAAGNQNEVGGDYQYFKKDTDDENTPWAYYSYKDYTEYLNGDKTNESMFSRYKDRRKEIEGRLESGNVDAKYDVLGAITDESVLKRIIIVGAAENLGTHKEGGFFGIGGTKVHDGYTIAAFSQCGERVDVIAPGVDIHSTVKNGYGKMSGTSMASPHVAGVVGLIFSANPDISADAVKEIISNSATGEYGSEKYGLVNAENAVEAALDYTTDGTETEMGGQFAQSKVPSGAVEFNGHYYYVYDVDTVTDWSAAQEYCEAKGGYLSTITSQEENDFLYNYIHQCGYESAYFGLTDEGSEGTWSWCNGEPLSYVNWADGEPNNENDSENYGMLYWKYTDGAWNDGDFGHMTDSGGTAFICEWGEYTTAPADSPIQGSVRTTSDERDIVLVLDVSGSMSGTPMAETQKASAKFVNTILDKDASIGVVTYDNSAYVLSDFSVNKDSLISVLSDMYSGGGTNIESGLSEARTMLSTSSAKKKIIVLMSDGKPNDGKEGDALVAYADEIKEDGVLIYTLGFFEDLGGYKSSAQQLMERIASDGCHYEVANADDLVFFFGDIADQLNGQKYIYVRIACPVDVSVTYQGQTLNSAEDDLSLRTDFGTLTFEENEEAVQNGTDDRIKVLRLKEGTDYDLRLTGTGHGLMDYTIGFMDDEGNYSDLRKFEDIKITKRTVIDTVAATSKESTLNIDENGDGKYDLRLRAGENGYGEEIKQDYLVYIIGGCAVLLLLIGVITAHKVRTKKKGKAK